MIEISLKNYLTNELDIPVVLERPKNVPETYVIIELIDSGETNKISAATFTFTVTSTTLYETAVLRDRVKELLDNATSLNEVAGVRLGGEISRISEKTYKYILTYNFYYYREEN